MCFTCPLVDCQFSFAALPTLLTHMKKCKKKFPATEECSACNQELLTKSAYIRHKMICVRQRGAGKSRLPRLPEDWPFILSKKAFKSFLQQYELFPEERFEDVINFIAEYHENIVQLLDLLLASIHSFKIQFCLACTFRKEVDETLTYTLGYFLTENYIITAATDKSTIINRMVEGLENKVNEFEGLGSGWILDEIDRLDLRIGQYNPLYGGCHIDLPRKIQAKKAIINIQNSDEKCFLWSVCACLFPVEFHPERVKYYHKYENLFNLNGISFPMKISQITKFENQNEILNFGINVFSFDQNDVKTPVKPYRITEKINSRNIINLLLYRDHYFFIKNFGRLVGSYSMKTSNFCFRCYASFDRKSRLENHRKSCYNYKPSIVFLPDKNDKILQFKQIEYTLKFPYVIYCDFECILKKTNRNLSDKTEVYQTHDPISFCLTVIKNESEIFYHNFFRGKNIMKTFFKILKKLENKILTCLSPIVKMVDLNESEIADYNSASFCYLCEKEFCEKDRKVKDHCHLTGIYRGAAHTSCNLRFQLPKKIPLLIHNSKGYDSHFIISNIDNKLFKKCEIIPKNSQQMLSFSLDNIQFLDSYQFTKESLFQMVKNLNDSKFEFPIMSKIFADQIGESEQKKALLMRKGIFCYDYFDDISKFAEKCLPPKKEFYSSLNFQEISDADYIHAQKVWKNFDIKNFGQYHDLYLILDTVLLADAFQEFRKVIHREYGLDPCHFYTTPGLAWSACMKISNLKLELITDIDQYNFLTDGIRGGYSCVNTRYVKANNKYMNDFDPNKESTYIGYHDCNNLYGFAMNQVLPKSDFKWAEKSEISKIDWQRQDDDQEWGYILEVDIEYPEHLHDYHNDYPLASEKLIIGNDKLGKYQNKLLEKLSQYNYKRCPNEKLLGTFYNKEKYIIHYKNLKLYLSLGLRIKNIHRVLKFKQEAYLRPYIEKNTVLRQKAKNEFEKNLFKLMNNSVFGKSIENQRNRINMKLCLSEKQTRKYLIKPNFHTFTILNEGVVLIHMLKQKVKLNRPIYLGFACLELAKNHMYYMYYYRYKNFYRDQINLIYTDTDSFLVLAKTEDFYVDLKENFSDIMDFSNYKSDHFLFDKSNEKVVGKFKDEYPNEIIHEFIGLKPKLYSILYNDGKFKNTAKGLQREVLAKEINHNHYKDVLFQGKIFDCEVHRIQSKDHELTTVKQNKRVFQPLDDKRYYWDNGIQSYAFGHYKIEK